MHLAVSLVIRAEVQIARQTSQLQSIARATSSSAGAFIFAAATLMISGLLPASARPPPPATKIAARKTQPARITWRVSFSDRGPLRHSAPRNVAMNGLSDEARGACAGGEAAAAGSGVVVSRPD